MRNSCLKLLVFSFLFLFSSHSFSQGFVIDSISSSQNNYLLCDSVVNLSFSAIESPINSGADINFVISGTNFQPSQFQIIITWGDGSITAHSGGVSSIGIPLSLNPPASHAYNGNGSHVITVQVTNPQNDSTAFYTVQVATAQCMAYVYGIASVDCNNDGTTEYQINQGLPLIFTSGNNQFSDTTNNSSVYIPGMPLGTYTISVDPTWLNANGFMATVMPQSMNVNGPTTTFTTQILLICQPTSPNTQCVSGTVYCDANGNGIFDNGEAPIPNAPISIQTNTGITINTTSNGNGSYSGTFSAPSQTPTIVMVNPNWLSQNGYSLNPSVVTTNQTACNQQNPPVNFGITNCDSIVPNQGCVSGFVWCDANGDGDFDTNELPLFGAPITLYGSVNNVTLFSDSLGFYSYCGTMLNQTTVIGMISTSWLASHGYTISNPNYTMIFMPNLNTQPLGFGVNCGGAPNTCADLWTTVTPWIGYYQNQTNYIRLNYGNYGPGVPGNYTLTLTYPVGVTPVLNSISNPNYVIAGNTITWSLVSFASSFSFDDLIYFMTPMGIPSGTAHYFTSTIAPSGSILDCSTSNNAGSLLQLVGNSYDPNDKTVNLEQSLSPVVQDELTYIIRFQNTGTAPAQDVFLIDTLSANLDWTTLTVLEATHAMQLIDLGGGVMRFDFPQIWLADSTTNEPMSHGHVVFKIKELVTNTEGSEIYNTAHIYFDWNPAIITNTTYNVNATLSINELDNKVMVFPNPTNDLLEINAATEINEVSLYSLSGNLILTKKIVGKSQTLQLADLNKGIYILQVQTAEGITTKKIVKQ